MVHIDGEAFVLKKLLPVETARPPEFKLREKKLKIFKGKTYHSVTGTDKAGFWFRIHVMRIRIHHFFPTADPGF
jgi:hypothetical protein